VSPGFLGELPVLRQGLAFNSSGRPVRMILRNLVLESDEETVKFIRF
jgi:hypothetical protein